MCPDRADCFFSLSGFFNDFKKENRISIQEYFQTTSDCRIPAVSIYMLYCVDNGELLYGSDSNSILHHAYYSSNDYPYDEDEMLMDEINAWLENIR